MISRDRFVDARSERWGELEALAGRGRRGIRKLSAGDILRLGRLYRIAASDLALAMKHLSNDRVAIYINGLVKKAHAVIYQRTTSRQSVLYAVRYSLPLAYRRIGRYTAFAVLITVVSAVLSAGTVLYHGENADLLLGHDNLRGVRAVIRHHHLWMGRNTANHSVAANFIMVNNIKVAFILIAGGILLGALTVVILIYNGIQMGVLAAMVYRGGLSRQFWSFVFPHGVIELSVIFLAGGAGLALGDAILRPGMFRRGRSLMTTGRQIVPVIVGCVPLLVVAGTIEGFFSASNAPAWVKIGLGLFTGVLLYAYLLGVRPARVQLEDGDQVTDILRRLGSNGVTSPPPVVDVAPSSSS